MSCGRLDLIDQILQLDHGEFESLDFCDIVLDEQVEPVVLFCQVVHVLLQLLELGSLLKLLDIGRGLGLLLLEVDLEQLNVVLCLGQVVS